MLKEPTIEKLKAMRLEAMVSAWNEQHDKPDVNRLSFDERFGMLVDAEWLHRENRRLGKALREAKLKLASACLEDIEYSPKRELDRAQIRQLASCRWVAEHQNVLVYRNDRDRQDVSRVRTRPAGMPEGAPCDLPSSLPPLRRARPCSSGRDLSATADALCSR